MKMKVICFLFFAIAVNCLAQQDRATVTGTVTDKSGAVIPGAQVTIKNTGTNATYTSATTGTGQYSMPNLPLGTYQATFQATGFRTAVSETVSLGVNQTLRLDVQLEVGATAETIEVRAEAPLLQTESPEVSQTVGSVFVRDLPLNIEGGRIVSAFAFQMAPGIIGSDFSGHINGSPTMSKETLIDGVPNSGWQAGQMAESSPSPESVEEFKVQTSGISAENGRSGGGVFNYVMKSGTNQLRGSVMGEIRNEALNANSFTNNYNGVKRPRDRRTMYVFSGGGPVYIPKVYNGKDKTFFYATYEKYTEKTYGFTNYTTVPIPEWYDGNMSRYLTTTSLGTDALGRNVLRGAIYDPNSSRTVNGQIVRDAFTGNMLPVSQMSAVSRRVFDIMKKYYLPDIREASGQYALINNSFRPTSNNPDFYQKQFSIKMDHNISDRQKLSSSYAYNNRPRDPLLDKGGPFYREDKYGGPLTRARIQTVKSSTGMLAHDMTLRPNLLNHFSVGVVRWNVPSTLPYENAGGGAILGIKGIPQDGPYPDMEWAGGDRVSLANIGYDFPETMASLSWSVRDSLSWIHGSHSVKFGFDYRSNGLNSNKNIDEVARFNFTNNQTMQPGFSQTGHPFASFFLGQVDSGSASVAMPSGYRTYYWAGFVQDDWKVKKNLTLNVGLRWEYQPPPVEVYDRLSNFCTTCIDPATGLPGTLEFAGTGPGRTGKRSFLDKEWNDFSPRFGFAYQMTSRMVLRGAYGVNFLPRMPQTYDGVPHRYEAGFTTRNIVLNPGNYQAAFNWDSGYPGVWVPDSLNPSLADKLGAVYWDPEGRKVGYSQQWNFNLQFELPYNMSLDLGYVGNLGVGENANVLRMINQTPTDVLALGSVLSQFVTSDAQIPASAKALGAIYPYKTAGTSIPVYQTLAPYPQIRYGVTVDYPQKYDIAGWMAPLGFHTYHGFQLQLNKTYSSGVGWLANYTFSKNLTNIDSIYNVERNAGRPQDTYNLKLEKSLGAMDRAQMVKIGATLAVPVGKGKRFGSDMSRLLDGIIGGWTVQVIGNYYSGAPLNLASTATTASNYATNRPYLLDTGGQSLRLDSYDESKFDMTRLSTAGTLSNTYFDTSKVKNAAGYVRGNASFATPILRGKPQLGEDASVQKNWMIKEKYRVQFRCDLLNPFNRHQFSNPNTDASSPLFGQITGVSGTYYRKIQLGLRLDF
jgi:hypothetical protein